MKQNILSPTFSRTCSKIDFFLDNSDLVNFALLLLPQFIERQDLAPGLPRLPLLLRHRWWPAGPVSLMRPQVPCLPVLPHNVHSHHHRAACGRRPRRRGHCMGARCTRPCLTAIPAHGRSGWQARQGGPSPPRWPAGRAGHWRLPNGFAGHRVGWTGQGTGGGGQRW
jgi:hypothetical protein